jgi:hypothetical protein
MGWLLGAHARTPHRCGCACACRRPLPAQHQTRQEAEAEVRLACRRKHAAANQKPRRQEQRQQAVEAGAGAHHSQREQQQQTRPCYHRRIGGSTRSRSRCCRNPPLHDRRRARECPQQRQSARLRQPRCSVPCEQLAAPLQGEGTLREYVCVASGNNWPSCYT